MRRPSDWKWKIALVLFAVTTAAVVFWPLPTPPLALAPAPSDSGRNLSGNPFPEENMLAYTVQEGDTIESIARLFVVLPDDIRRANGIPAADDVASGRRIHIPPPP